jgi:hypothetical protein
MMIVSRMAAALAFTTIVLGACSDAAPVGGRVHEAPLVFLDSVRIEESDSILVAKPNAIAIGGDGTMFISDYGERRVLQVGRDGRGLRVLARTGGGPGEVSSPSSLAVIGDSLLVVSNTAKRLEFFDAVRGTYRSSQPVNFLGGLLGNSQREMLLASVLTDSGTSFALLVPGDSLPTRGGSIPDIYTKNPLLAQAFASTGLTRDSTDIVGILEASNTLYRWRGTSVVDTITMTPVVRRGAKPDILLELLRDPTKAPTLAFQWSVPFQAAPLSQRRTALVFFDPTVKGTEFVGPYYLHLADWVTHRACEEVRLPVPEDTPSRFAFRGDTLTALVQHPTGTSGSTWLVRWRVGYTVCPAP